MKEIDNRCLNAVSRCAMIAIFSLFLIANSFLCRAASLEKISDGEIILSLFGENLHFREKDAVNIEFWNLSTPWRSLEQPDRIICNNPRRSRIDPVTIADWLNDHSLGACLTETFSKLERNNPNVNGNLIVLYITSTVENGIFFPGAVALTDLPPRWRNPEAVGFPAVSNRENYRFSITLQSNEHREWAIPLLEERGEDDALGFMYLPEKFRVGPGFRKSNYILPAERRKGNVTHDLRVECSYGMLDIPSCSFALISFGSIDQIVSLRFTWDEGPPNIAHPRVMPNLRWLDYDKAARNISASIFSDRQPGYLQ